MQLHNYMVIGFLVKIYLFQLWLGQGIHFISRTIMFNSLGHYRTFSKIFCCCSVAKSCLTLCDPMDCSTPGFPLPHYLPEFAETHVHWIGNAIQPSYPLLSPSSPALKSFPASRSFPMSQLFASGGQSIGASASALVLPVSIQGWFPLGWTGLISLLSKGLSRIFSNTTVWKHQFFGAQPSLWSNSHICTWLLKKTIALTIWTFVGKVMSLLFNTLSRFVIAFLERSKRLLISRQQSPSTAILELKKIDGTYESTNSI